MLAGFLQGKYGTNKIPVPVPGSRAGRQFIASNGNLKGKKVQSLISQLTSNNRSGAEQYFVIVNKHGGLGPGIWRRYRVKNAVSLAFALVDQKPKVDTRLDFHGLVLRDAEKRLPGMVEEKLNISMMLALDWMYFRHWNVRHMAPCDVLSILGAGHFKVACKSKRARGLFVGFNFVVVANNAARVVPFKKLSTAFRQRPRANIDAVHLSSPEYMKKRGRRA